MRDCRKMRKWLAPATATETTSNKTYAIRESYGSCCGLRGAVGVHVTLQGQSLARMFKAIRAARQPVVNPFDVIQERRMDSHRASVTNAAVPAAGSEGPAAEEPEEPEEPAEAMPVMAAIEQERQPQFKPQRTAVHYRARGDSWRSLNP